MTTATLTATEMMTRHMAAADLIECGVGVAADEAYAIVRAGRLYVEYAPEVFGLPLACGAQQVVYRGILLPLDDAMDLVDCGRWDDPAIDPDDLPEPLRGQVMEALDEAADEARRDDERDGWEADYLASRGVR